MTQPARPDPARTPSRNDHVRPGPAPSGAVRPARRAVGTLAFLIGTRAWPGQPGRPAELSLAGAARRHVRRLASSATWPGRPRHPVPGWTVVSAGLAPVLATGGWLVAEAVQPASYSPIRKTISVLAGHAGTDRWIMTGALFLVGGCQLVLSNIYRRSVRYFSGIIASFSLMSKVRAAMCSWLRRPWRFRQ